MNIRVIGIRGIPSTYGGMETIVGELAPRWVQAGHEVTVYCRRSLFNERPHKFRGVNLVYLPGIEHKVLSTVSHAFISILHTSVHQSDVVLVWNAANGPFGWILRCSGKVGIINVDGMEWLRPKWKGIGRIYYKWAAKMAVRSYDVVITDAAEMKRLYLQQFGVETNYIANGGNVEFSREPERIRKYGLEPRQYYLIASRLIPDNNADLIIEALVKSKTKRKLAVVGGADYKGNKQEKMFLEKCKSLSDERVKFFGHIGDSDDVRELHLHCFVYVHGHEFGGINPALLKALGCSNCVLALDTPFNSEVLDGGKYGVLFKKDVQDLTGIIDELEENADRVEAFRKKANEPIIERFNWDHISNLYLRLFEESRKQK